MSALNVDRAGAGAHSDKHKHSPHHCFIRTSQRHREALPGVHVALLGPIVRFHASPAGPDTSTCPPPIADPIRMSFCSSLVRRPNPLVRSRAFFESDTARVPDRCRLRRGVAAGRGGRSGCANKVPESPGPFDDHRPSSSSPSQVSCELSPPAMPPRIHWRRRVRHSRGKLKVPSPSPASPDPPPLVFGTCRASDADAELVARCVALERRTMRGYGQRRRRSVVPPRALRAT